MTRLCILMALAAAAAYAQVTASITGRVSDATGAPLSGARVTVKSLETGAVRSVTSSDAGTYRATSLPLGRQEVKADKAGFKESVRTGITLAVGQEAVANLTLEIGEISQQVTVTDEVPVVNTTTASSAGLVGEAEVKDLPLNGRSIDNLITLNPGAISYGLKSPQTSTSNGNTFAVAGRRPADNLVLVNGIEYTGSSQLAITPGGVSGELLGVDAIREFNVLTDTYNVEYGKRSGAQVTMVTQSGTNQLHGSLFEFLRNSALDARNFFDQNGVPPFRRNQFGGALGGPLRKNKLFLFGNYEGFRQSLAFSSLSVVPDASARSGALVTNANPAILKYFALWPLPNGPSLGNGTARSYNNPLQHVREDFGSTRGDYVVSNRDTFSFAWTVDDGDSITPVADPLFGSSLLLRNQVASLEETHVFTPNVLNTFRFGYSRAAFNLDPYSYVSFPADLSFVAGQGPGGIVIGGGTTTTGVAALTAAGPNNAAGAWNRRNLFTVTDNAQWNHGIHQFTFGGWFQRVQDNENSASRRLGQASFASLQTFLQSTATSFQVIPSANELGWRSVFGAWFVEDVIRLRRNFTVNLGLRHEFTNGWNEVSGRAANYVTDANGLLQTDPLVGPHEFTQNNAKKLFAPRVGIAWDVFGNGKTSVRAGFGIYYSLIDDLAFLINSLPPYNGAASFSNVSLPSVLPIVPGTPPPAGTVFAPQGVQSDAKTPAVNEWNIRIEQQLDSATVLRIGYVGSFGYHGFVSIDPNTVFPQLCAAATCTSGGTGTARGTVSQGAEYIPVSATRPNPKLGAGFFWFSEGNSSYNALQLDLSRRLSHRLQLRGNFTWSKNLDINSALTGAQANNQAQMVMDRTNLRRDWGLSALNVAAQSSISARYELPMGFQLNGIATFLSGFPFTPQIGTNRSGNGDTRNPDRPDYSGSFTGPVILGSPDRWYDPNAFALPTPGTFGNVGRGVLTGPGLADLDMSLFKTFKLVERTSLQFRAECFNLLNHPNFGTPNAIVFSNGAVSSSAGLITTTVTTSRQIQFGLKLMF